MEFVATRWGVTPESGGKVVWFELGQPPATEGSKARSAGAATSAEPSGTVRLLNMPPHLVLATLERGDALLREFALLEMGMADQAGEDHPRRGGALPTEPVLEAAAAAVAAGHSGIDVAITLPLAAADLALERLGVADEAERLASSGELLSTPSLPEIAACRTWLLSQITLQLQGGVATPWDLPGTVGIRCGPGLRRRLAQDPAGDGTGRHCCRPDQTTSSSWTAPQRSSSVGSRTALVAQRLTTIIPSRLRQAHLAGFARYQLTGEAHILDKPVRLPALRRDGSTVEVELTITPMGHPRPTLFAARLRRT